MYGSAADDGDNIRMRISAVNNQYDLRGELGDGFGVSRRSKYVLYVVIGIESGTFGSRGG
jgi:hypothetical protein